MTGCAVDEENLLRKKAIASRENQLQKKTEVVNLCVVRNDTLQAELTHVCKLSEERVGVCSFMMMQKGTRAAAMIQTN